MRAPEDVEATLCVKGLQMVLERNLEALDAGVFHLFNSRLDKATAWSGLAVLRMYPNVATLECTIRSSSKASAMPSLSTDTYPTSPLSSPNFKLAYRF
jgi:hypothetical protein